MQKITTFLMFEGKAQEAINFYISLFKDSKIISLQRNPDNDQLIQLATISLNGQQFMCIDSSTAHAFTFTPAMSLYVTCDSEEEIDELYKQLSNDGKVLMPLDKYPFSNKFGWVADKFGVTWQLNLA
jgi:predicted 3-demethylubiquinone-9 3-methyltransferase (glyoxalase superfamily)